MRQVPGQDQARQRPGGGEAARVDCRVRAKLGLAQGGLGERPEDPQQTEKPEIFYFLSSFPERPLLMKGGGGSHGGLRVGPPHAPGFCWEDWFASSPEAFLLPTSDATGGALRVALQGIHVLPGRTCLEAPAHRMQAVSAPPPSPGITRRR